MPGEIPQNPPSSSSKEIWNVLRPFLGLTAIATGLGVVAGLATAWLLGAINEGLHASAENRVATIVHFGLLCLLSMSGAAIAGVANSVVGQRVVASLRKTISHRIVSAPLRTIEVHNSHSILAILANDIDSLSVFTFNFAGYAVSAAIVVGSLVYLAQLSVVGFLLLLGAILAGGFIGAYARYGWERDYKGVRTAQDTLQEQYRAITDGAKEVRMNSERKAQVHGLHLSAAADTIANLKISAMRRFWVVDSVGNGILFLAIGTLIALQGVLHMTAETAVGAVLVMLYIRAPIEQLVSSIPAMLQAKIAVQRIAQLSAGLSVSTEDVEDRAEGSIEFERLELRQGVYQFGEVSSDGFKLGPANLSFRKGEITFVVGENGSGKTTLIKMLLGLYECQAGAIYLNGSKVSATNNAAYRSMFSAVFSDYFLFSDLIEHNRSLLSRANSYLQDLEIAHKVSIEDNRFSTIDLSTGQRKRLALIHAYLEDRPIMMFDEWAADQDPTFRRVFYERILPDLKAQGKTLIVVSHDDRFFHHADHLITMRDGQIVDSEVLRGATRELPSQAQSAL